MNAFREYGSPSFDWFWYGLTLILPPIGVLVAIWWLAHDRVGPGLAVLLTGWVAVGLWTVVLVAIGLAQPLG